MLPERTTIRGEVREIWHPNGRGYLKEEEKVVVIMSINDDNSLHVSVSCGGKGLSKAQACEFIAELLPSHYVDFIPQEVVNEGLLSKGIKTRIVIGEDLEPVQHFEKQL
jgi:siroheme synthase (precorrin-2 oxidase/ferrochelatase)